ncbi:MAG TPA: hypothetical protein P5250_08755, partial [Bacteroidales bacterium]|nr:hypothetical protein [Bacteroidales bacterium]
IILPITDFLIVYAGFFFITKWWEAHIIKGFYPSEFLTLYLPAYIIIWIISIYLNGGYDSPIKLIKIIQGIFIGTIFILIIYALLPENLRFSRALIILGATWGVTATSIIRLILHIIPFTNFTIGISKNKRAVIVGDKEECYRIAEMLKNTSDIPSFIGFVFPNDYEINGNNYIGNINQLNDIIAIYKIDEIIFCAKNIPAHIVIDKMSELQNSQVEFHIAPPESLFLIGSKSIRTAGDPYIFNINSITKINNRRNKRFFDLTTSIVLLPLYPLIAPFMYKPLGFLINLINVLLGKRSWVGYANYKSIDYHKLPIIKKGVLDVAENFKKQNNIDPIVSDRLNMLYARDYQLRTDINIFIKGFRYLGNKSL